MGKNVAQKLIESHLLNGKMIPGEQIALKIDQTLTQDATGTMVMLELAAMGLKKVKTEVSAQYVDHNLLQTDFKNADDHLFLQSACKKFGIWYSRAGNGVSHPVHMEQFGIPGKTLLGSDSHTCAGGSMGMLAIGAGGLEVALAMMGEPFYLKMPKIAGVKLVGKLPHWVSAKDVVLEMLKRHDVAGGVNKIFEYFGPGLKCLSAMDRHVIANMGQEMGATTSVFPSDEETRKFLKEQNREQDWRELVADLDCTYDEMEEIDLSALEPLIALPSSPGKVVPVREVEGLPIYQAMIGSSANPGLRDFLISAKMVDGRKVSSHVSFDVNPTSRQILENLANSGNLSSLITAGARIHQAGCNGCIGMGQAPATDRISLRTVPRNFPGRSGTKEDLVYLCSPETATASALTGKITDPRALKQPYPSLELKKHVVLTRDQVFDKPDELDINELIMGPNIKPLPEFEPLREKLDCPVILKLGDNISTDEILPAGTRVLPFRSNIPEISKFTFDQVDPAFYKRAMPGRDRGWIVIGGSNYGQGSSREHAAIAPNYLGVKAVIAKSYARIHRSNLINFGILPLTFVHPADFDAIAGGDELFLDHIHKHLKEGLPFTVKNKTRKTEFQASLQLAPHEFEIMMRGGLVNLMLSRT